MSLPSQISLREVGPRDGLQNERPVPLAAKLELLEALVAAGLRRIEATAFVSPRAVPAMADAAEVAAELHRWPDVRWSALVASRNGARRALAAGVTELEYVVSAADGHSWANVRRDTATALGDVAPIAATVHAAGGFCEVIVATAWDCPFDGPTSADRVVRVVSEAIGMGADAVCLADTIGTATPARVVSLLEQVRDRHPDVPLGLHMHNTRGMGIAGVLAALQFGVVDIDASIGGLGGCPFAPGASGNVATEETAYLCHDSGIETGTDLGGLIEAARLAQRLVGRPLDSGVLRAGDRPRGPSNSGPGVTKVGRP
ncbi:hydroxymethylglutaryl-CoA lyase [Amycolatopsis acidiphila]|uniref:Hydroxymethylglutaryl-CoA lyase n=1 Tax=Amycolatopsis acidiphila TaxID=715473 RepID=A0A558AIT6_9PSEU|nr:hydroxymethylglutaryl-CoA lyase [Amycolatopsis acidiphila]TVT24111.1 hydroxymethylglutaryl-CoA lyase [Amycolatopsis acidiphila]UIJ57731.1 hydroxymethylglutaryl-CoA lyase [Amycolatopsis acidiphila]